jgi:hypothetical protein
MAFLEAPEIKDYSEVPWYRKRWFFILSLLFFIPAGVVIAFSGEVYLLSGGKVMKFPANQRLLLAVAFLVLMTFNLYRVFTGL